MMLTSTLENIGIVDAAIVAVLGYAVVFFGLILLMGVIIIMGKAFMAKDPKAAAKAAAAKEYAAKKGTYEEPEEHTTLSGIADRPYCKGRAYDPNRYSAESTEE